MRRILLQEFGIAPHDAGARHDAPVKTLRPHVIAKVRVEMFEQLAQRKALDIRMDDAHFELIDVEQRVQHARHDADRCVETLQKGLRLRPVGLLRQQSLEKPNCLQRLSQIMTGGGEEARFGDIRLFGGLLGGVERLGCALFFSDVRERDHDPFNQPVMSSVRQNKPILPNPALG